MRQIQDKYTEYLFCTLSDKYRTGRENTYSVNYKTNTGQVHRIPILYTVRQIQDRYTEYLYRTLWDKYRTGTQNTYSLHREKLQDRYTEYLFCTLWDKHRTGTQNTYTVHCETNTRTVNRISIYYIVRKIWIAPPNIRIVQCERQKDMGQIQKHLSLTGSDRVIRPTHRISVMYSEIQIWGWNTEHPALSWRSVNDGGLGTAASEHTAGNIWSYETK
jgi:hypothetical protein